MCWATGAFLIDVIGSFFQSFPCSRLGTEPHLGDVRTRTPFIVLVIVSILVTVLARPLARNLPTIAAILVAGVATQSSIMATEPANLICGMADGGKAKD
jgi:hypothetical protein